MYLFYSIFNIWLSLILVWANNLMIKRTKTTEASFLSYMHKIFQSLFPVIILRARKNSYYQNTNEASGDSLYHQI